MIIPQDLLFVLSIIVSSLSHYLRDAGLPRAANALIAGISIVAITAVVIAATTGFSADLKSDVLLFCSTLAALWPGLGELSDLLGHLKEAQSPLVPTVPQYPPSVKRSSANTPIVFPPTDEPQ